MKKKNRMEKNKQKNPKQVTTCQARGTRWRTLRAGILEDNKKRLG